MQYAKYVFYHFRELFFNKSVIPVYSFVIYWKFNVKKYE